MIAVLLLSILFLASWGGGFVPPASAAELTVVRPQFLVNSSQTRGAQTHATIAMNRDGIMFVTWTTESNMSNEIKGRAFLADGQPWTKEFRINTLVRSGYQHSPDVATGGNNDWVVAWPSWEGQGANRIYAKTYSSSETTLQFEVQVDTDGIEPSPYISRPDVAMFPNGDYIVLWDWTDLAADELVFLVRMFDSSGNPLTGSVRINQEPSAVPINNLTGTPDLDVGIIGGQMTAFASWSRWSEKGSLGAEVRCRRFDPYTMTFEDEFAPSPPGGGILQGRPTVDLNDRGDVLLTWQEQNPSDMLFDVHALKFTAADSAWGDLLAPPGNVDFEQHRAQGLMSESGGMVLAWTRYNVNVSDDDVYLMMYDSGGAPMLDEAFRVNSTTRRVQRRPSLAMNETDGLARLGVAWESNSGDGSDYGIFAAVFDFDGFPAAATPDKDRRPVKATAPPQGPGWDQKGEPAAEVESRSGIPSPLVKNHAAYPNPFNPATTIRFELERPTTVTLAIHDLAGRRIATLAAAAHLGGGAHEYRWSGKDDSGRAVASGTYVYRLQAGGRTSAGRLTVIK